VALSTLSLSQLQSVESAHNNTKQQRWCMARDGWLHAHAPPHTAALHTSRAAHPLFGTASPQQQQGLHEAAEDPRRLTLQRLLVGAQH
jgi:hypothetical protein